MIARPFSQSVVDPWTRPVHAVRSAHTRASVEAAYAIASLVQPRRLAATFSSQERALDAHARLRTRTALRQSSSSSSSPSAIYRVLAGNRHPQRGHQTDWTDCCASRIACHSALSLRRSSACRRSLGWRAWTVQVVPSNIPTHRQASRTKPAAWMVTAHCGGFRRDVSFPDRGPLAGPRGSVSRSGEMPT